MKSFEQKALDIRKDILNSVMIAGPNGAHIAPSLSCVEILTAIFACMTESYGLFVLSKGHAGLALYAAMKEFGIISAVDFDAFETNGGEFPGQPSKNLAKHIEYSSGSLGMGLSYACGRALALRQRSQNGRVFVLLGDGETNEGSVWESAMFAEFNHLKNLIAVVDFNGMQGDGFSKDILTFDQAGMWRSCGWHVRECDGHDSAAISRCMAEQTDEPLVVLARTVKGKGVSFMENAREWHHGRLNQKQFQTALSELEVGNGN